jgi:hypothetical protein
VVIVMVMVMSYGSDGSGGVVEQLAYHAKLMFDIG